jgi:hypothetical protein
VQQHRRDGRRPDPQKTIVKDSGRQNRWVTPAPAAEVIRGGPLRLEAGV